MPLRLKLILIALVAAVFPLAGWRFVVQMETTLRQSQERALSASARTLARALPAVDEELQQALRTSPKWLARPMQVDVAADGYSDDWGPLVAEGQPLRDFNGEVLARVSVGLGPNALNLWIDVDDSTPVRAGTEPESERADQVEVIVRDQFGERRWRLTAMSSGVVVPQPVVGADGRMPSVGFPAWWMDREGGYRIELRLPRLDPAMQVGLRVLDFPVLGADLPRRIGALRPTASVASDAVHALWQQSAVIDALVQGGTRLRVLTPDGYVLARAGSLRPGSDTADDEDLSFWRWLRAIVYRYLMAPTLAPAGGYGFDLLRLQVPEVTQAMDDENAVRWRPAASQASVILSAAAPIRVDGQIRGSVLLEQTSDALLLWTNRALGSLLLGGLLTMIVAASILFGYAGYLSFRIRRLRNAAENALTPEGRVLANFPRSSAVDEIGDLSRSFARLLEQVVAYTEYLRTLGSKLSHELATPLAVVRSSLENLEQEPLPESARVYAERARSGAERLSTLLRNLAQASRMERAIASAEAEDFDLRAVITGAVAGYRDMAEGREMRCQVPEHSVPFHGAPELIHQALDKLVDNALSFTPEGGWIKVSLEMRAQGGVDVAVANQGPPLPQKMQGRLFDSLITVREGRSASGMHLGLGLYVVRLIAELHGGQASASDLPAGDGVEFRLSLIGMPRKPSGRG